MLFVFFRVLAAYWLRHSSDGDYAVVVLMARHMAEGIGFPLFFYGQSYMGSLEPMVSALLCRIAGDSGFTVCMGTVLFSIAMVPFIYLLGRNCGGAQAGLGALLFCAIGPSVFFHFASSPHGGYAALMLAVAFLMWAVCEVVYREKRSQRVPPWVYGALGFVAGIAWWVNPLVSPVLLACTCIFLSFLGLKGLKMRRIYAVVPGFLLGLIPFLGWNARNGWQSFNVSSNVTPLQEFGRGVSLFFVRFGDLVDLRARPLWLQVVMGIIYGGASLLFIMDWLTLWRHERGSRSTVFRTGIVVYFIVFVVCFAISDFAKVRAPRYLLPLVSMIGVVLGSAVAGVRPRFRWMGWLVLLLLCGYQFVSLKTLRLKSRIYERIPARAEELSSYLVDREISEIYGEFRDQHLNYILNERYVFCNLHYERYDPYFVAMEASERPAVINDRCSAFDFLQSNKARYTRKGVAGYWLTHDISFPTGMGRALKRETVLSVVTPEGKDVGGHLLDRSVVTGWTAVETPGSGVPELVVRLSETVSVSGIRLLCRPPDYPRNWTLYGRASATDEWTQLLGNVKVTPFFRSGRRFYAKGGFYRAEGLCDPMACRELKISFPDLEGKRMRLSELEIRTPHDEEEPTSQQVSELARWIDRASIGRVYADRWESSQLDGQCAALVIRDSVLKETRDEPGISMALTPDTAMVLRTADVDWTRDVLSACLIDMTEREIGPWTVFFFSEGQWRAEYAFSEGLAWLGFGCVSRSPKHCAVFLAKLAESDRASGDFSSAISGLERGLKMYPNHRALTLKLSNLLQEQGRGVEAAVWRNRYERMWQPDVSAAVSFGDRVHLVGLSTGQVAVKPGGEVQIDYFWKCDPVRTSRSLVVFAHFRSPEGIIFQDDRPFLQEHGVSHQPFEEIFVERRVVKVPYEAGPGPCELWIGIYDESIQNERISLKTGLPTRSRAVRLPVVIDIRSDR